MPRMMTYHYGIAGLGIALTIPAGLDPDALLPAFADFKCDTGADMCASVSLCRLLDETTSEMGVVAVSETEAEYVIDVSRRPIDHNAQMMTDRDFARARAYFHSAEQAAAHLSSMLRMQFAQVGISHQCILVHASAVVLDGKAYLFMAPSGTGKSTHSQMWMRTFAGCELLNDDNPALRIVGGQLMAYGTPWSGKTPCYRHVGYPVGGIAKVEQAANDEFLPLHGIEAFAALLPGCSALRQSGTFFDQMCDALSRMVALVPVGIIKCRPRPEAAQVCRAGFVNY